MKLSLDQCVAIADEVRQRIVQRDVERVGVGKLDGTDANYRRSVETRARDAIALFCAHGVGYANLGIGYQSTQYRDRIYDTAGTEIAPKP